jgi:hypothetical protein
MHRPDSKVAASELAFTPLGPQVRILRDGSLLYGRSLPSGVEALAWAEEERQRMVAEGWTAVVSRGKDANIGTPH